MGLSQTQLADFLEVSKQNIGHWESGRREPSEEIKEKLAKVFQTDLATLLVGFRSKWPEDVHQVIAGYVALSARRRELVRKEIGLVDDKKLNKLSDTEWRKVEE
jgi:DNA-binding XRE family transcriptional regulator